MSTDCHSKEPQSIKYYLGNLLCQNSKGPSYSLVVNNVRFQKFDYSCFVDIKTNVICDSSGLLKQNITLFTEILFSPPSLH